MNKYSPDQISYLVDNVPKYAYIKMDMMNRIKSGEISVGEKIETEANLCHLYNCSRLTVRKALDELMNEGYIYKIQGLGAFVKQRTPQKQNLEGINSCTKLIEMQNMVPSKTIIDSYVTPIVPVAIKEKLGLSEVDSVFFYSRVYLADGKPVIFGKSYFNSKFLPGIENIDLKGKSIVNVLKEKYGLELKCSDRNIKAVLSDSVDSSLLGVSENYPLLQVSDLKTGIIQGEEFPIEYYTFLYVTDRIRYSPEMT